MFISTTIKTEYFYYNLIDLNRVLFEYDLSYKSKEQLIQLRFLNLSLLKFEKNLRSNFRLLVISNFSYNS